MTPLVCTLNKEEGGPPWTKLRFSSGPPKILTDLLGSFDFLDAKTLHGVQCGTHWAKQNSDVLQMWLVKPIRPKQVWTNSHPQTLFCKLRTGTNLPKLTPSSAVSCALQMLEFPGEEVNLQKSAVFCAQKICSRAGKPNPDGVYPENQEK